MQTGSQPLSQVPHHPINNPAETDSLRHHPNRIDVPHPAPAKQYRSFYFLVVVMLILALFVSGTGLFSKSGGTSRTVVNAYGDTIKLYGEGIYRYDSFFRAPIFRGTDFTIFFLVCPLLLAVLVLDVRRRTNRTRLLLLSMTGCVLYYATNIAFGVAYNSFHLVYIALLSSSFFALAAGVFHLDLPSLESASKGTLPLNGLTVFLSLTGLALFVAWLPDILTALKANRPLLLIEQYTTEVTYVLDMGIIAPACLLCVYLLHKKKALGYVLLDFLLTLCVVVGIMLPVQTIFQITAGIPLPLPVLLTKVGSFCALALFAFYFRIKSWKNLAC
jgi:uncharacterized membrane protein